MDTNTKLNVGQLGELGITATPTSGFHVQGTEVVLSRHEVLKTIEREGGITLGRLFELAHLGGRAALAGDLKNILGL